MACMSRTWLSFLAFTSIGVCLLIGCGDKTNPITTAPDEPGCVEYISYEEYRALDPVSGDVNNPFLIEESGILVCWIPRDDVVAFLECMLQHKKWILWKLTTHIPDSKTAANEDAYFADLGNKQRAFNFANSRWTRQWKEIAATRLTRSELERQYQILRDHTEAYRKVGINVNGENYKEIMQKLHEYQDTVVAIIENFHSP